MPVKYKYHKSQISLDNKFDHQIRQHCDFSSYYLLATLDYVLYILLYIFARFEPHDFKDQKQYHICQIILHKHHFLLISVIFFDYNVR